MPVIYAVVSLANDVEQMQKGVQRARISLDVYQARYDRIRRELPDFNSPSLDQWHNYLADSQAFVYALESIQFESLA